MSRTGREVVVQGLESARAVLACRIAEPDDWCRRCGFEGISQTASLAHEQFGLRSTTLLVRVRRHQCTGAGLLADKPSRPRGSWRCSPVMIMPRSRRPRASTSACSAPTENQIAPPAKRSCKLWSHRFAMAFGPPQHEQRTDRGYQRLPRAPLRLRPRLSQPHPLNRPRTAGDRRIQTTPTLWTAMSRFRCSRCLATLVFRDTSVARHNPGKTTPRRVINVTTHNT